MSKLFFDVFPTLKADKEIETFFQSVEVQKVTSTSAKDHIKVHIFSTHLIPRRTVVKLERLIENQLFQDRVPITIVEQYQLSELYTPENLMKEYRESILFDLEQRSVILRNMFYKGKVTFEEDQILHLTMADTIIAKGKTEEIVEYLHQIYEERFQIPIQIKVDYEEVKDDKYRKMGEMQLQQEVDAIAQRNYAIQLKKGTAKPEDEPKVEKKEKTPKAEVETGKAENKKASAQMPAKSNGKPGGSGFQRREYPMKKSDDPNVIYGRDFDDPTIELKNVVTEMGEITIRGMVTSFDTREIRNEKTILMFAVTDFTDTIMVKMFTRNDQLPELLAEIKPGVFLKIKGVTTIDKFDGELTIGSVSCIRKSTDFRVARKDKAPEKRVELHCHTKMSDMDAVSNAKDLIKRAHSWGHKAIAITDHGVVQAFTEANHVIEALDKEDPFKIIYGVEGYLVDDLTEIAVGAGKQTLDDTYVVFDIETTGFSAIADRIIEIGAVKVQNGEIVDTFSTFVNPQRPIPFKITQLTSIEDEMVIGAPTIEEVLPEFLDFVGDAVLVAHNASFDVGFIEQNCRYQEIYRTFPYVDTVALARVLLPSLSKYKLDVVSKALSIPLESHHRAVDDAGATAKIFVKFIEMLKERDITTLKGINRFGNLNPDAIRKLPTYHVIILARNDIGRVNLYKLVSESHLTYFGRRPRIPKSVLNAHREGLIVGSACEAGELYRAILDGKSDEVIAKIVDFYDYLEIQPLGNNQFMIASEKISAVKTEEDIKNINRRIVKLGEQFDKPVVGTCDVHFMDPEDEVYRRIIMAGKGFDDADSQPPLYLRTTEEMLEEFQYLGSEKAYEIVVKNTNLIADMVEKISPVRPDKCPPVIEDSDQTLRRICYEKAYSMYGDPLPEIVKERLDRELNSIISNGFAVMYIIAQKLVWKSVEDGYLVGSRGSVGSSFVATMAGITEVNPLSPHYYCKECHYSDFYSEEVRSYAGGCGHDMPDKRCPKCGAMLVKDGFDIPFETFLGFKGNKEPDIDLNFSGDYQSKAHKYTEVIFGEGQTFRAGTIAGLADKTAYGYVKKYYEEHGDRKRNCEIERIVGGCTGIRRSTGQHPGGIIVLPYGEDINNFTPIQHPANDMTTDIVTTHFDYHSIDHNLLKLDILGHDDPTMIKTLEELINSDSMENEYDGVNNVFRATDIPLDDPGVMSLFTSTEALGVTPEEINCPLGCLGVPEFGTDFVIQMVCDTKPQKLSDLIRISGLSHGTDVWLNNAQTLINEGKCTISSAICTRDDIMVYLINKGLESEEAFTIMERVRKGTVAKGKCKEWPEFKKDMLEHDVPEWYIWSCEQIKYMFPKAHAAAYVMMAYRIAYCKINYPLAYYAAFFGIRASAFSYEIMGRGKDVLLYYMKEYKKKEEMKQLSPKDEETMKNMKNVLEMYARGYDFLPIDIYKSKATQFQIVDGKLLPPFNCLDGMGDKAAEAVEAAAASGEKYLSIDDFVQRTKISKTLVDKMSELGLLGNLPKSNQLSLFDL